MTNPKKFKLDVASRPTDITLDIYEQIPISEYGTALLRGMGWTPGTAIGLTNPKFIEPIEFIKRPGLRTGLGAKPILEDPFEKKYIKPGESREPKEPQVLPIGSDGRIRHIKSINEELVPLSQQDFREGQQIFIMNGLFEGFFAAIKKVLSDSNFLVRVKETEKEITLNKENFIRGDDANAIQEKKRQIRDRESEKKSWGKSIGI